MDVNFGTVSGTPKPLSLKTSNPVCVGQVMLGDGKIYRAYIKKISPIKIAVEYALAEFTNQCGLTSPTPVVTNWNGMLAFSSIDASTPSLFHHINSGNDELLEAAFNPSSTIQKVINFDEVISNPDRNQQNILIKGNGELILIDHELALSGPKNEPTQKNILLEAIKASIQEGDEVSKQRVFNELDRNTPKFEGASISEIANSLLSANIINAETKEILVDYIEFRIANLAQLLKRQVGITSQIGLDYSA